MMQSLKRWVHKSPADINKDSNYKKFFYSLSCVAVSVCDSSMEGQTE